MRNIESETDYEQLNSKQLVDIVVNLIKENQLLKGMNKLKDGLVQNAFQDIEDVKKEFCTFEVTIQSNEQLISEQKIVIDDLTRKIDRLNHQLHDAKSSAEGKIKLMDSHKDTIQSLGRKLKDAEKYINDQNFVIDQLKKKVSDKQQEHDAVKDLLKERYLERLEKAKQEMEEERDRMTRKLKQMREFYDAEGRDYQKRINQMTEELDLLRRADFRKPDQSTSRGRGRKRPSSTNRDGTSARGGRGRGRGRATSRKAQTPEVDSTLGLTDDENQTSIKSKRRPNTDSMFEDSQLPRRERSRSRSPSPMPWQTPRSKYPTILDTDED